MVMMEAGWNGYGSRWWRKDRSLVESWWKITEWSTNELLFFPNGGSEIWWGQPRIDWWSLVNKFLINTLQSLARDDGYARTRFDFFMTTRCAKKRMMVSDLGYGIGTTQKGKTLSVGGSLDLEQRMMDLPEKIWKADGGMLVEKVLKGEGTMLYLKG